MSGARNRCADADYCPACGQPRECGREVERFGLHLDGSDQLSFGRRGVHLSSSEGIVMRALLDHGKASHEFLMLRLDSEADDQITRVYAHRLKSKLQQLTDGVISLRSIWGWGYEIYASPVAIAA